MSVAAQVREAVASIEHRAFLRARDLSGSRSAVDSALSRLAADGELVRVHKGLYYRPPPRGRRRPLPLEVGLAIGGRGAGPAGISAARLFGLTTQVPGVEAVAVPGRAPADREDVRFVARSFSRREQDLSPYEAGLLEVLRDFESISEEPFDRLPAVVQGAIDHDKIRVDRVREAVNDEWDLGTRHRWHRLEERLGLLVAA